MFKYLIYIISLSEKIKDFMKYIVKYIGLSARSRHLYKQLHM